METFKNFLNDNQQKIVLGFGFLLVAGLAFSVGRFTSVNSEAPAVRVEQALVSPSNYSPTVSGVQSIAPATAAATSTNCDGQIKGTASMIYHVPGDPFYARTTKPTRCFSTEAQAQAAGYRKSGK